MHAIWTSAVLLLLLSGCSDSLPVARQWESMHGPGARSVSALYVNESLSGGLFAGLENGDLYRSTDGGGAWWKASTILKGARVSELTQADTNAPLFAATAAGAFVSPDRGRTWSRIPIGPAGAAPFPINTLLIDPWNTDVLYAGSERHGMFKSTDNARSWSPVRDTALPGYAASSVTAIEIDVSHPDIMYAATDIGILKSTDQGSSWRLITQGYSPSGSSITRLLINRRSDRTVLYSTSSGAIYRTTDGGDSWSPSRYGLESDGILTLTLDPVKPDIVYAGTRLGMLVSTDFGSGWTPAHGELSLVSCSIAAPAREIRSVLYAFGGGIGVLRSSDAGATWVHADGNLGGGTVTLLADSPLHQHLFAAVEGTLVDYDPATDRWNPSGRGLLGNEVRDLTFDRDSLSAVYAATSVGIFKSTDDGGSWEHIGRKLSMPPSFLDEHPWLHSRIFASGEQGLYVSTDKGASWTQTKPIGGRFNLRSIAYAPNDAGKLLACTTNSSVIASSDGGLSWSTARYGLGESDIMAVTRDNADTRTCFAWSRSGEGFRSTNDGLEWNRFVPPWKRGDTVAIAVDPDLPSSAIALVNTHALFYSASGGATWFRMLDRRLPGEVTALLWDDAQGMAYAAVQDAGVYRLPMRGLIAQRLGE